MARAKKGILPSQPKTSQHIGKVLNLLRDNNHVASKQIAKATRLSISSVYVIVRKMKESGIGIYPTPQGYMLSEHASKRDDVRFARQLLGRYASLKIALNASAPHIRNRWNTIRDRTALKLLIAPLSGSMNDVKVGMNVADAKLKAELH